ncbi:uncharacterized protein TRIADDRAFT_60985 [Trichoplax adhaerens]|uniref:USP domain-containing protein n=1 Tax=Trichoplax adhaerens TaxID=10228 RepID=B3S9Q0_TRIAD|nr:hypothetical protein TRIADDRAFT_60985 [Trichoplax adhaerens]EDV20513.1 hypothetical protein TRIADDRAFT_60985 [Trichoplax adhaerens]|eukprot:XP_002116939.1 hypothetical protein TRIADDRAFT_60985 [Trichoplax adhaerens]
MAAECAQLLQSIIDSQHESAVKRSAIITLLNYNANNQPSAVASIDVLQVAVQWFLYTDIPLKNQMATILLKFIVQSDMEFCMRQLMSAHRLQQLLLQSTNVDQLRIAQFFHSIMMVINRVGHIKIDQQVLEVLLACMISWDNIETIVKMASQLVDHCRQQGYSSQLCLVLVMCIARNHQHHPAKHHTIHTDTTTENILKVIDQMSKLIGVLCQDQSIALHYTITSILSLAMSINISITIPDIPGGSLRDAVLRYSPLNPSPFVAYALKYVSTTSINQSVLDIARHTVPFPDALLSLAAERLLDWMDLLLSKSTHLDDAAPGWLACILQFFVTMIDHGRDKVIDSVLRSKIDQICRCLQNKHACSSMIPLVHLILCRHYHSIDIVSKYVPKEEELTSLLSEYEVVDRGSYLRNRSLIIKKIGLDNLGNTCYMNSILQVLYMIDGFRKFIISSTFDGKQPLLIELQRLFVYLTLSQRESICPREFARLSRPKWFQEFEQQDSSEFLKYLLSSFDKEEKLQNRSRNDIQHFFQGEFVNHIRCRKCNNVMQHKEEFLDLMLAFGNENADTLTTNANSMPDKATSSNSTTAHRSLNNYLDNDTHVHTGYSLQALLEKFLSEEQLLVDQGNSYSCDRCNESTDAEIMRTLTKLPPCLILSLQRFSYNTLTHKRSKIFRKVHFPNEISLPCHMADQSSSSESDDMTELSSGILKKEDPLYSMSQEYKLIGYNLHSAVIHSGLTADGGHYYSIVKTPLDCNRRDNVPVAEVTDNGSGWIIFNDTHVQCNDNSNALNNIGRDHFYEVAYILFYMRHDFQVDECNSPHSRNSMCGDLLMKQDLVREVILDNARYAQENQSKKSENITKLRNLGPDDNNNDDAGSSGSNNRDYDIPINRYIY